MSKEMTLCVSCFRMGANGRRVQRWGTICCHCCRRRRGPFYPKSFVGSHFTFISDGQTVHCLSRLSCAFWRWVDPPPHSPRPMLPPPPRPLWNNSECCGGCEAAVARARGRASSGSPFVLAPTWPASPGCPCGRPLGVEADAPHSRYPTDTRIPGTLPLASSEATFGSDGVGSGRVSSGATEQNVTNMTLIPVWFLCN